jgi:thiol-disulfide isomerase/thioredoxin
MKFNLANAYPILCLFISLGAYSQSKNDSVTLTGKLINFTNEIQVEDMSEMKELELPNSKRTFLPDSLGNFSICFKLLQPNYFRLGRNILYLSPKDSLSLFVNRTWPDSATFKGSHSFENEYLRTTPFPKAGSFLEAGDHLKGNIQETIDYILVLAEKRKALLNSYQHLDPQFKTLEYARVNADIINSLRNIHTYFPAFDKLKGDSLVSFQNEYEKLIKPYVNLYSASMTKPEYLKLAVYRNVLEGILKNSPGNSADERKLKDWIKAAEIAQHLKEQTSKKNIASFRNKIKEIQSNEYRKSVDATYQSLLSFGDGDIAKDFVFKTAGNQIVHVNNFVGKVIYIDLWATWCGSCIEELPFMDTLKEKYKGNKDIVFLTLSIDGNELIWKNHLKGSNASGIQGIIDRNKLTDYKVATIPKIIVINKSFKVVTMNGSLPSDSRTMKLLDDLLK